MRYLISVILVTIVLSILIFKAVLVSKPNKAENDFVDCLCCELK